MRTSFSQGDLGRILEETVRIALKAGAVIKPFYRDYVSGRKPIDIMSKNDGSPVTEIDHKASNLIVSECERSFPGILIVSEENESASDDTERLVYITIDPVDGTDEFLEKTGGFSTKVALVENGLPIAGVTFCPALDTLYYSMRGGPSWRQYAGQAPEPIRSTRSCFSSGVMKTLFNKRFSPLSNYGIIRKRFAEEGISLPSMPDGSAGIPRVLRVAEGAVDVFVRCSKDPRMIRGSGASWDYASDWIILKNSGGVMRQLDTGKEITFPVPRAPVKPFVALANPALGEKIFP